MPRRQISEFNYQQKRISGIVRDLFEFHIHIMNPNEMKEKKKDSLSKPDKSQ